MIPIRLQSTNAGAPVLTQTAGSLIALLDIFLVTTLGWTKEFTDTNIAVYRTPIGTNQKYFQVIDDSTTNARIRGYSNMTDAVTGTGAFPPESVAGSYWYKGAWGYDLIGTDSCFYLRCATNSTHTTEHLYFFGDFIRTDHVDINNTMCTAKTSTSNSSSLNPFGAVTSHTYVAALANGDNAGYLAGVYPENATISLTNTEPYPDRFTGGMALSRASVFASTGVTGKGQQGTMPGMLFPNNRLSDLSVAAGDTFLDADGEELLIHRARGVSALTSASTWRAIHLTKDWDLV